jgi:DNA polymerase-3 subunit beta
LSSYFDDKDLPHFGDLKQHAPELWDAFEKYYAAAFEPGLLSIASSNAEQEEAKEEIEIDYGGDKIETGFNVTYLMDALANMSQDMVCIDLNDSASSALLSIPDTTGFKYVVMPMRI